jgi:hypothetical protein
VTGGRETRGDTDRPLDRGDLIPLLTGKTETRQRPIGFWSYPQGGIPVRAKQSMEELHAAQSEGREPEDPAKLFADAGQITERASVERFPGHAAWIDGNWKLHRVERQQTRGPKGELYDLAADPTERRDLVTNRGRTSLRDDDGTRPLVEVSRTESQRRRLRHRAVTPVAADHQSSSVSVIRRRSITEPPGISRARSTSSASPASSVISPSWSGRNSFICDSAGGRASVSWFV